MQRAGVGEVELRPVGEHQSDGVAALDAEAGEAGRDARHALRVLRPGDRDAVARGPQRDRIGPLGGGVWNASHSVAADSAAGCSADACSTVPLSILGRTLTAATKTGMALTVGTGPFGQRPGGTFNFELPRTKGVIYFEDSPAAHPRAARRRDRGRQPPREAAARARSPADLLLPAGGGAHGPARPRARSTRIAPTRARRRTGPCMPAARSPRTRSGATRSHRGCAAAGGLHRLLLAPMDEWLEEDEPAIVHARDPYHRVDVAADTSRHVRVVVNGEVVADSTAPAGAVRDRPADALVFPPGRRAPRPAAPRATRTPAAPTRASRRTGRSGDGGRRRVVVSRARGARPSGSATTWRSSTSASTSRSTASRRSGR